MKKICLVQGGKFLLGIHAEDILVRTAWAEVKPGSRVVQLSALLAQQPVGAVPAEAVCLELQGEGETFCLLTDRIVDEVEVINPPGPLPPACPALAARLCPQVTIWGDTPVLLLDPTQVIPIAAELGKGIGLLVEEPEQEDEISASEPEEEDDPLFLFSEKPAPVFADEQVEEFSAPEEPVAFRAEVIPVAAELDKSIDLLTEELEQEDEISASEPEEEDDPFFPFSEKPAPVFTDEQAEELSAPEESVAFLAEEEADEPLAEDIEIESEEEREEPLAELTSIPVAPVVCSPDSSSSLPKMEDESASLDRMPEEEDPFSFFADEPSSSLTKEAEEPLDRLWEPEHPKEEEKNVADSKPEPEEEIVAFFADEPEEPRAGETASAVCSPDFSSSSLKMEEESASLGRMPEEEDPFSFFADEPSCSSTKEAEEPLDRLWEPEHPEKEEETITDSEPEPEEEVISFFDDEPEESSVEETAPAVFSPDFSSSSPKMEEESLSLANTPEQEDPFSFFAEEPSSSLAEEAEGPFAGLWELNPSKEKEEPAANSESESEEEIEEVTVFLDDEPEEPCAEETTPAVCSPASSDLRERKEVAKPALNAQTPRSESTQSQRKKETTSTIDEETFKKVMIWTIARFKQSKAGEELRLSTDQLPPELASMVEQKGLSRSIIQYLIDQIVLRCKESEHAGRRLPDEKHVK